MLVSLDLPQTPYCGLYWGKMSKERRRLEGHGPWWKSDVAGWREKEGWAEASQTLKDAWQSCPEVILPKLAIRGDPRLPEGDLTSCPRRALSLLETGPSTNSTSWPWKARCILPANTGRESSMHRCPGAGAGAAAFPGSCRLGKRSHIAKLPGSPAAKKPSNLACLKLYLIMEPFSKSGSKKWDLRRK